MENFENFDFSEYDTKKSKTKLELTLDNDLGAAIFDDIVIPLKTEEQIIKTKIQIVSKPKKTNTNQSDNLF